VTQDFSVFLSYTNITYGSDYNAMSVLRFKHQSYLVVFIVHCSFNEISYRLYAIAISSLRLFLSSESILIEGICYLSLYNIIKFTYARINYIYIYIHAYICLCKYKCINRACRNIQRNLRRYVATLCDTCIRRCLN